MIVSLGLKPSSASFLRSPLRSYLLQQMFWGTTSFLFQLQLSFPAINSSLADKAYTEMTGDLGVDLKWPNLPSRNWVQDSKDIPPIHNCRTEILCGKYGFAIKRKKPLGTMYNGIRWLIHSVLHLWNSYPRRIGAAIPWITNPNCPTRSFLNIANRALQKQFLQHAVKAVLLNEAFALVKEDFIFKTYVRGNICFLPNFVTIKCYNRPW